MGYVAGISLRTDAQPQNESAFVDRNENHSNWSPNHSVPRCSKTESSLRSDAGHRRFGVTVPLMWTCPFSGWLREALETGFCVLLDGDDCEIQQVTSSPPLPFLFLHPFFQGRDESARLQVTCVAVTINEWHSVYTSVQFKADCQVFWGKRPNSVTSPTREAPKHHSGYCRHHKNILSAYWCVYVNTTCAYGRRETAVIIAAFRTVKEVHSLVRQDYSTGTEDPNAKCGPRVDEGPAGCLWPRVDDPLHVLPTCGDVTRRRRLPPWASVSRGCGVGDALSVLEEGGGSTKGTTNCRHSMPLASRRARRRNEIDSTHLPPTSKSSRCVVKSALLIKPACRTSSRRLQERTLHAVESHRGDICAFLQTSHMRYGASSSKLDLRAAVAKQLDCSPPKANRVQSPVGSHPDFHMWESCRTKPLVGGFSRVSPVSPALSFRRCSIITSLHLHRLPRPRLGVTSIARANRTKVSENTETSATYTAVVESMGSSLQSCPQCLHICAVLKGLVHFKSAYSIVNSIHYVGTRHCSSDVLVQVWRYIHNACRHVYDVEQATEWHGTQNGKYSHTSRQNGQDLATWRWSPVNQRSTTNLPGAVVAERSVCSPPTEANRVQSPVASLRIFESGIVPDNAAGQRVFSGSSVSPTLRVLAGGSLGVSGAGAGERGTMLAPRARYRGHRQGRGQPTDLLGPRRGVAPALTTSTAARFAFPLPTCCSRLKLGSQPSVASVNHRPSISQPSVDFFRPSIESDSQVRRPSSQKIFSCRLSPNNTNFLAKIYNSKVKQIPKECRKKYGPMINVLQRYKCPQIIARILHVYGDNIMCRRRNV
ncbi:hypothetical protein PR048_027260 [Dryococelus australis]|uniref:Uncharacterized protein n=1 Tax=Dryococelus australis TaxID=614101 RepID=A0ABQ9GGD5_9NEOP|nr:hypothetical protein PR048_027260 [Dryococelus australis]